jgi:serine/threonine protein kinase
MASAQANPNNNAQNHTDWPSYSHHTLLFNPTINKEVPEREQLSFANQSRQYLQKHRAGFIFVRWLRNDANKKDEVVGLFVTAKRPRELVAIKKITFFNREHLSADPNRPLPAEIEQSTLDISDNYVQCQLPLHDDRFGGRSPFPQVFAFQVHRFQTPEDDPNTILGDATLYSKYYNGGTLNDLLCAFQEAGRPIPESFIWHYLAEVLRALAWIHLGDVRSRTDNLYFMQSRKSPQHFPQASRAQGWDPIIHHDLHGGNIWLHYPTEEERAADPSLSRFSDEFPQIIVGDWGFSLKASNGRPTGELPPSPPFQDQDGLNDKCLLAWNLRNLIALGETDDATDCAINGLDFHRLAQKCNISRHFTVHGYSRELQDVWEHLFPLAMFGDYYTSWLQILTSLSDPQNARSPQWRQRLLTNDVLYGQILAQVDVQVDGYIQKRKNAESVRWTQGQWQVMPYRSPISDPRARRWDFRAVRSHLSRVSRKQAQAYNGELTPPSLSFVRHNLVYNTNTRIRREESTPPEGYTQQPDPQSDPSDDLSTASIAIRVPGRGQIQDMIRRRNELGKGHENEHNLTQQAEAGLQAAEASGASEAKLAELRLRLEACKANEAVAKAKVEQMQWQIRLAEDAREFNDAMGARRDANAAATDAPPNERKAKREALARAENRARRRLEMWKDTRKRLDEVNEELKEAEAAHAEAEAQVLASTAQRTKSTKLIIKRGKSVIQAKKVAASEYDPGLDKYDGDMTTPKKPPRTTQQQREECIVGGVRLPSYPFVDKSWLWERPVGTPSSPAPMPRGELIRYRLRQQWEQERLEERRKKKEAARAAAAKGGRAGQ